MSHSLYGFVCALLICAGMSPILSALFGGSNSSIEWLAPTTEDTWTSDSSYYSCPSGSGTSSSPYLITEAGELAYFAANGINSDTYISLSNSIDLSEHTWVPINVSSGVTVTFTGNGYSIYKVKVYDTSASAGGLFGTVSGTLNATQVYIYNADITTNTNAGALVGYMASGTLQYIFTYGTVSAISSNAGGIVGYCGGTAKNCFNWASVNSSNESAGGIVGYSTGTITACYNYGDVTALQYGGGVVGYSTGTVQTSMASDCSINCPRYAGGVAGYATQLTSCGFKGDLSANVALSVYRVGAICGSVATVSYCFGVANVTLSVSKITGINEFGAATGSTYTSTYAYTNLVTTSADTTQELRKYSLGDDETDETAFSTFIYASNINGGYPFPQGLVTAAAGVSTGVYTYLSNYGFDTAVTIESFDVYYDSSTGRHYIEFGSYPQSFVGSTLNTTLENWFNSEDTDYIRSCLANSYTLTTTTSLTETTYYSYIYTDGTEYCRVGSANPYTTGYTFNDATSVTITSGTTYWFKVEPIKWIVLNYSDYLTGDASYLYVVADNALAANIPWASSSSYTLWSSSYCSVRTWLNNYFLDDAFDDDEAGYINTNVTIKNNSTSSTTDGSGTSTTDTIWLLSYTEVVTTYTGILFTAGSSDSTYDQLRRCMPSDFALVNYCYHNTSYTTLEGYSSCYWWLRSAYSSSYVRVVGSGGPASSGYYPTSLVYGVRPALQLSI